MRWLCLALPILLSAVRVNAEESAVVAMNQLCDDIRRAEPGRLEEYKDELKRWLLDDIGTYNRIVRLEDAVDQFELQEQEAAENALLIAAELGRLTANQLRAEDVRFKSSARTLQDRLDVLDRDNEEITYKRDLVAWAMREMGRERLAIDRLENQIERVNSGYQEFEGNRHERPLGFIPARHVVRDLTNQINDRRAAIETIAERVARAHYLSPPDYPRDMADLADVLLHTQVEWEDYMGRRTDLARGLAELQSDYRRRGRGVLSGEVEVVPGAQRARDQLDGWDRWRTLYSDADLEGQIRRGRDDLRSSQAAFRELWLCAKERERELGGRPAGADMPNEPDQWLLRGNWSLVCDPTFANMRAAGTFRVTIAASGEAFGRFWEEDDPDPAGTITGTVRGGRPDLTLHYDDQPLSLSGQVNLNPDFSASGAGSIVGQLWRWDDCQGSWQSQ